VTTSRAPHLVAARLARVPGVHAAVTPDDPAWRRGGTALVNVQPVAETSTPAGKQTITRVRQAAAAIPGVQVGGSGPLDVDFARAVYGRFPLMLGVIAAVTFLLLARAFRSLLLAAKAVLLNLLSVGAIYGVLVLVWQDGHGSGLWGIPATGSVDTFIPVMVFAFLYGLSMDYEVFILARMREAHDPTGSTTTAIVEGIGRTGRLVTSAALILFAAFASLAAGPQTTLKVFATGLGAGVLLDATVVRALLVPALVSLFGRWNWWLPAWAARPLGVPPSPAPPEPETDRLRDAEHQRVPHPAVSVELASTARPGAAAPARHVPRWRSHDREDLVPIRPRALRGLDHPAAGATTAPRRDPRPRRRRRPRHEAAPVRAGVERRGAGSRGLRLPPLRRLRRPTPPTAARAASTPRPGRGAGVRYIPPCP
jgi:hypothetical protein